jgi:hypothetical protein
VLRLNAQAIDRSAARGGGGVGLSGGTVVPAFRAGLNLEPSDALSQPVASEFSAPNIGSRHIDPVLAPASRI